LELTSRTELFPAYHCEIELLWPGIEYCVWCIAVERLVPIDKEARKTTTS